MALTQFKEWEPKLGPVTGIQAQEPRVVQVMMLIWF